MSVRVSLKIDMSTKKSALIKALEKEIHVYKRALNKIITTVSSKAQNRRKAPFIKEETGRVFMYFLSFNKLIIGS